MTPNHQGTLHPPPVPTLPPPKLPGSLTLNSRTDTLNSALSLTNSIVVPALPSALNIPKLKHHRHSGAGSSKADSKSQSSDKFRQLYQIRRNNGDVLSQDFLKNIQAKQSSSSQLNTNTNSSFIDTNTFELWSSSLSSSEKKVAKKEGKKSAK